MVNVQMTRSMDERPPKILGFFTKKQLLGIVIAVAIIALLTLLLPFSTLTNLEISILPALPVIVLFFFPENEISPMAFARYYIKKWLLGQDTRFHDGNTVYYRPKTEKKEKIKRYKSYKGVR